MVPIPVQRTNVSQRSNSNSSRGSLGHNNEDLETDGLVIKPSRGGGGGGGIVQTQNRRWISAIISAITLCCVLTIAFYLDVIPAGLNPITHNNNNNENNNNLEDMVMDQMHHPPPGKIGGRFFPRLPGQHHETLSDEDFIAKYFKDEFTITGEKKTTGTIKSRYNLHILLDKPIYRVGETVYVSAFVMDVISMKPYPEHSPLTDVGMEIYGPLENVLYTENSYRPDLTNGTGIISFRFTIPNSFAGGEYSLKLFRNWGTDIAPAKRKFEVLGVSRSNPKFQKQLEFKKKSYGPGDRVEVLVTCKPPGAFISSASAIVDGTQVWALDKPLKTDQLTGKQTIEFVLPKAVSLQNGDGLGRVTVVLSNGADLESVTKTIPIITQKLNIQVYPESGALVEDLRTRIYIEVTNSMNEPADVEADIIRIGLVSSNQKIVSTISTKHEGRGVSDFFLVEPKSKFALKIRSPSSLAGKLIPIESEIITSKSIGAVISSKNQAYNLMDPITVDVQAREEGEYTLSLFKREVQISSTTFKILKSTSYSSRVVFSSLTNHQENEYSGVLRLTLTNKKGLPLAERLIFRHPKERLAMRIESSSVPDTLLNKNQRKNLPLPIDALEDSDTSLSYPTDAVEVRIWTFLENVNEKQSIPRPISAMINVFVTDDSLGSTLDKRRLPPRLPSAIFLESDVDHLEDANIYLSGEKDSDMMIDLLLGTQGWRRFAYKSPAKFFEGQGKNVSTEAEMKISRLFGMRYEAPFPMMFAAARGGAQPEMMMAMFAAAPPPLAAGINKNMVPGREKGMVEVAEQQEDMVAVFDSPENADDDDAELVGKINDNNFVDRDEGGVAAAANNDVAEPNIGFAKKMRMPDFRANTMYERIYAYPQRKFSRMEFESENGIERSSFTDTVFSAPGLKTECDTAKKLCGTRFRFGLSDSVTTFRVIVDGYSLPIEQGNVEEVSSIAIGSGNYNIQTRLPLEIDLDLPTFMMNTDEAQVPIMIKGVLPSSNQNNQEEEEENSFKVNLKADIQDEGEVVTFLKSNLKASHVSNTNLNLVEENSRTYISLRAKSAGNANVSISAHGLNAQVGGGFPVRDSIIKSISIGQIGFPQTSSLGGMLDKATIGKILNLTLPSDYLANSLSVSVKVFTSPVGQLNEAIEALLREPNGCFEQTSATTYPLVMALRYLNKHSNSDPILIKRAKEMLERGYKKLVSYESPGGGFEWFGEAPGHEALTAYGIVQFATMSLPDVGMPNLVDMSMLERTRRWLMSRRDGSGGFLRNPKSLDSFGAAPSTTTNAYITWSLVRAGMLLRGDEKLDTEIQAILDLSKTTSDSYVIALAALTMLDVAKDTEENHKIGLELCTRLQRAQSTVMNDEKKGSISGGVDSITRSQGESLLIETTSLSALAFMHAGDSFASSTRLAIEFLTSQCKSGRYSSTQATSLALQAIIEYDDLFSKSLSPGKVQVYVNGQVVDSISFSGSGNSKSAFVPKLETERPCKFGMVFNECGSKCTPTCETPVMPCVKMCVQRCECPQSRPLWNGTWCVAESSCTTHHSNKNDGGGILEFSSEKILSAMDAEPNSEHTITLKLIPDNPTSSSSSMKLPFSIDASFSVLKPPSSTRQDILLFTSFEKENDESTSITTCKEKEVLTMYVKIVNNAMDEVSRKAKASAMTVAVIGIPAGMQVRTEKLHELKEESTISFYEVRPGSLTLYWRALKPSEKVVVPVELEAMIPGAFEAQSSRAYLYYTNEFKSWKSGLKVKILPSSSLPTIETTWK